MPFPFSKSKKRRAVAKDLDKEGTSALSRSRRLGELSREDAKDNLLPPEPGPIASSGRPATVPDAPVNNPGTLRARSHSTPVTPLADGAPVNLPEVDRNDAPTKNKNRRNTLSAQPSKNQPANHDTGIGGIVNQVMATLLPLYRSDQSPDLAKWQNLDPFGLIDQAPSSPLDNYDFNGLSADRAADFLRKINIARASDAPARLMPPLSALDNNVLTAEPLSSGIPPLQHSIWIGNPINETVEKQRKFMEALAKNKRDNPDWTVVLWTDQSRALLNAATPDSIEGKMRGWAAENNIVLANIDEVFAGKNKMALNDLVRLERNKGGTGISAAGDMIRMSVLQRFGGMYVDGDKPINLALDDIARAADGNKMRLALPDDKVEGRPILSAETEAEKKAVASGLKIVEVQGFAVANEKGRYQSCALCAQKKSPVFDLIMNRIRENYRKDRNQLKARGEFGVNTEPRAQRMEVIMRTGPSIIESAVDPESGGKAFAGKALMPLNAVTTYTGTTSWTQERPFTGGRDVNAFANQVDSLPLATVLQGQALILANAPFRLPEASTLDANSRAKIAAATQKSLTTLSYTIPNELGRLDLNYLKPHLVGLTLAEQQLAVHTVLETLTQPQFAGLANSVTVLRLPALRPPNPNDLNLAVETLDLLMSGKLANLKLNTFSVQDAALEGNLSFLRYANDKGLLTDFNKPADQPIDGGRKNTGEFSFDYFDVVKAAVVGGNQNAIHYLASLAPFKDYKGLDTILKAAAEYGQIDTVIALAEAYNYSSSIKYIMELKDVNVQLGIEVLKRYQRTFGVCLDITQSSNPLLKKAIPNKDPDLIRQLLTVGVKPDHLTLGERKSLVNMLTLGITDQPKCLASLEIARSLKLETDLLIAAADSRTSMSLISTKLNEIRKREGRPEIPFGNKDPEAEIAGAHAKFPDSEAGKNDYNGVAVSQLSLQEARSLVQKALVYVHDHLRTGSTGRDSRIDGWTNLLITLKKQSALGELDDLIDQTLQQLNAVNSANRDFRTRMQVAARDVLELEISPDLL